MTGVSFWKTSAFRLMLALSGKFQKMLLQNGVQWTDDTISYVYVDGSGGGSHTSGLTYDASNWGAMWFVSHTEQTGSGSAVGFLPVDFNGFKKLRFTWRMKLTAASGRCVVGIYPQSAGTPAAVMSGITAGNSLASYVGSAVEAVTALTADVSPRMNVFDVSNYQGLYYIYVEAIGTDGTSGSKLCQNYIYNLGLDA